MFKNKYRHFINKKIFYYIFLFSITQRLSFATVIKPSPAWLVSVSIDFFFFILLSIFVISLLIKIIRYFLVKPLELKAKLKKRGITVIKILTIITITYVIKRFFYCSLMNSILGPDHNFFKLDVVSCNSFMPCPKETYQRCDGTPLF